MANDPRTKKVTINGDDVELRLNAGSFRLAELYGEGLSRAFLKEATSFALGARLLYIAALPDLSNVGEEDGVSEGDVIEWLVQQENANELVGWVLARYRDADDILGKSLGVDKEALVEKLMEQLMSEEENSTSTSTPSTP